MMYAIIGVLALLVDQFLKFWTVSNIELNVGIQKLIPGVVHLTHIKNFGAVFGLFNEAGWLRWAALLLMVAFAAVMILALIKGWLRTGFARWTGTLLLAGILGNGIDRAIYGYVVDMLELDFMKFAIFNIADALILVCGILFCISVICGGIGRAADDEPEEEEMPARPVRRRRVEEEEEEEAPARPVRRSAREEDVPVRRTRTEPAAPAAPRVRRVIDETTIPVPDRGTARPVQRPVRPAAEEDVPVRTARPVQRPVRPAAEEAPARTARPVQRPVRPAAAEEEPIRVTRPVQRPVRPAAEEEIPVRPAKSPAAVVPQQPARPAAESAKAVPPAVKTTSAAKSVEDEFDLDSILAEFK